MYPPTMPAIRKSANIIVLVAVVIAAIVAVYFLVIKPSMNVNNVPISTETEIEEEEGYCSSCSSDHSTRGQTYSDNAYMTANAPIPVVEGYCGNKVMSAEPFDTYADGLIGVINPPRAGPLNANRMLPSARIERNNPFPFVGIYKAEPYLRPYRMGTPSCQ